LVEVKAISVNPVDTKVRQNVAPENGAAKVLGWDVAGVVKAVGSEVTLFKAGDKVFYAGSIARAGGNSELHVVDERIVGHMPKPGFRRSRRPAADRHHRVGIAVRTPAGP
jgi:NADPH:quinone reductase-like Zn-dependent oxidoreductase